MSISRHLRVYVIDNKDWNAMAMGNGAIWVFRGIMNDMTDNELAIVVGHELAHYTHEHSRRQMRKGMWGQFGSLAALLRGRSDRQRRLRLATQLGASLGFSAWMNGYGRDLEDQADRVGLRYAHEGGFDVAGAPRSGSGFWTSTARAIASRLSSSPITRTRARAGRTSKPSCANNYARPVAEESRLG